MPALGMQMLDVIDGETGLFALDWPLEIEPQGGSVIVSHAGQSIELEAWLTHCFAQGVNLMAAMNETGEPVLFSDLIRSKQQQIFSDVIAIGNTPILWPGMMTRALAEAGKVHENMLKAFTWPETWDLSMIFLGWHHGLPAMVEEMALKHHKLTVHVFSTANEMALTRANRQLHDVAEAAEHCELKASVHAWDGMDTEPLVAQLRGCKVMMFYPEDHGDDNEDSVLELWYHEVAGMLAARKAKAKWWTPPKLMVLPRQGTHVGSFVQAACDYPVLETHVGSPDAFHDVLMARRLLNEACRHFDAKASAKNDKVFRFVDAMLGDTVLVESVASVRLLDGNHNEEANWESVYREALRRGWLLMGYLMPQIGAQERNAFEMLDAAFPAQQKEHVSGMHLLAGIAASEMDLPQDSAELLFCRRGVLAQQPAQQDKPKAEKKDKATREEKEIKKGNVVEKLITVKPPVAENIAAPAEKIVVEAVEEQLVNEDKPVDAQLPAAVAAPAEAIATAEVLEESVWPQQADPQLLNVLQAQVDGSVQMLEQSSEEALVKLSEILDMDVEEAVIDKIMAALTDLQNIDRVSQRMHNVKYVLQDWAAASPYNGGALAWEETVKNRYVMEEERLVLNDLLSSSVPAVAATDKPQLVAAKETEVIDELEEVVEEVLRDIGDVEDVSDEVAEAGVETVAEEVVEPLVDAEIEAVDETVVVEHEVVSASADLGGTSVPVTEEVETEIEETKVAEREVISAIADHSGATATVLEGEVMADAVWPKVADKRLIKVLEKQVDGSMQLLDQSAEDGLIKLTEILDMGVSAEVEDLIMAALTDLQNIDRVSQRMNNVKSCLQDWGKAVPDAPPAVWKEAVEKRYVMEEERQVLKEEL